MTSWSYIVYVACLGLIAFGIVNLANVPVPLANVSTSAAHPSFTWTEKYPSANGSASAAIPGSSNGTIIFQVKVSANQSITEGTPVVITVGGSEDTYYFANASSIYVGFFGADDVNSFVKGAAGTGFAGVSLFPSSQPTKGINFTVDAGYWLEGFAATIDWPSQGDKPLSIVIVLNDGSTASYTYQADVVHVASANSPRDSQVIIGAAATIAGISLFTLFRVVPRVRSGRPRKS